MSEVVALTRAALIDAITETTWGLGVKAGPIADAVLRRLVGESEVDILSAYLAWIDTRPMARASKDPIFDAYQAGWRAREMFAAVRPAGT